MLSDVCAYVAFAAVVEEGSLAAAARRLKTSKTAVSRYIGRLEALAGVKLVNRTSRAMSLTGSGAELYESCGAMLQTVSEIERMMRGLSVAPGGLLRIFAPPVLQASNLPALIAQFAANNPDIRIDFKTSNQVPDPRRSPFDIYFFIGATALAELQQVKLARYRSVTCASPSYLTKHGSPRTPEELVNHECILQTQRPRAEIWTFKPDREIHVRGRIDSDNASTALAAVSQGLGIARLPMFIVSDHLASGRLVRVLDEHMPEEQNIIIAYQPVRRLPGKFRAFIDFIRKEFHDDKMNWRQF